MSFSRHRQTLQLKHKTLTEKKKKKKGEGKREVICPILITENVNKQTPCHLYDINERELLNPKGQKHKEKSISISQLKSNHFPY